MKLFDEINKLDEEKNIYINNYIKKLKKFPYVYLWGISESCDEAINFFNKNNIIIKGIYNINPEKYNFLYKNIPVILQNFNDIDTKAGIVITCSYYELFRNKLLKKYPNIDNNLFLFDGYFLEDKDSLYYINNKELIINCYNNLADNKSKKIYDALLKYRFIRDPKIIEKVYDKRDNCYLDDIFIRNFKDGLYIDAGSYDADFITSLKNKVDIKNSYFYIFEPSKVFYNRIIKNLDSSINYKAFNLALCDKNDKMEFVQLQFSTSHIKDKKYNAYNDTLDSVIDFVDTTTLDSIVKNKKVTGIKADIEGAEESLLIGAANTIKRDRPIILLSIYHRLDDMFKLQNYLMSLNLNYKFYIRHYTLGVAKTVLYCIPN